MARSSFYAEITVRSIRATRDTFSVQADRIADALYALDDAAGASMSSNPRGFLLTFGLIVWADTSDEARNRALVIVRTALHATGGVTADWPTAFPKVHESVDDSRFALTNS